MDKSMIPILLALAAVVAAGAAMVFNGGGEDGGSEVPSGYPPSTDSLYFLTSDIAAEIGEQRIVHLYGYLSAGTREPIAWYTSNYFICELERPVGSFNVLRMLHAGECDVTASVDGKTATCHVTVLDRTTPAPAPVPAPIEPEGPLELNPASMTLAPGGSWATMANKKAEWSASDVSVCSIAASSDGRCCVVTALKAGECTLTATSGGESASCKVTVVGSDAPADVPSVSGASPAMEFYLELAPGGSKAIDVPSEYLSLLSMAQWSSSDPSVCTVTADPVAGKVTAVAHKAGKCDLTASLGFYSAVCHVTVGRSQ